MHERMSLVPAIVAIPLLIIAAILAGCVEEEDDGPAADNEEYITVDGEAFTFDELLGLLGTRSAIVNGTEYVGIPLDMIIQLAGTADPEEYQYRITAFDAYSKTVTWDDMTQGVLVEEETMTAFPGLPSRYKVRDVVSIESVTSETLLVGDHLYTWDQPADILGTIELVIGNESHWGVPMGDLVRLTVEGPEDRDYLLTGEDGYNRTVNWTSISGGVIADEERQAIIPGLEKSYWVRDLVSIEAVE